MTLTYIILLIICVICAVIISKYIYNNVDKNPSIIIAAMSIPLLFLIYYLTHSLINDIKEELECERLGGEIVNELCLDIDDAPVIIGQNKFN